MKTIQNNYSSLSDLEQYANVCQHINSNSENFHKAKVDLKLLKV